MTGIKSKPEFCLIRWSHLIGVLLLSSLPALANSQFLDPVNTPAQMRTAITQRPMMAVVQAGKRLVAVGSRGVIAESDDLGKTWVQAKVPVQSDLLAVHFPTVGDGWAVGHDGVVLHSADGGQTWIKQLDGRIADETFKAFYSAMGTAGEAALAQLRRNYQAGPALPFLDVWFETSQIGYAVGSFGMIIATRDGGKTWEPWLHRIDNPQFLNLNAIRRIGSDLYIVGERGQIYRFDRNQNRFLRMDTGYIGSFFGIVGNDDTLVAYGLRGTAYRSSRRGDLLRWSVLAAPSEQTIAAGLVRPDGSFVLVNLAGQFLLVDKSAKDVRLVPASRVMRMTGITAVDANTFIVTGLDGVRVETLHETAAIPR